MVKKMLFSTLAVIVLTVAAQAETWNVDPAHSRIGFYVTHMVLSKVYGQFHDFTGNVQLNGTDWDKATAEFTIQATSIDTDNDYRDGDLRKSEDFFNTEKYPTITFKSKKAIKGEGNKFQLVGDLTVKDVTKEVTFDCEYAGTVPGKEGKDKAGFSARTTINRQDYHITWSHAMDNGGLVVSNDVNIFIELELVKSVAPAATK